MPKDDISESDFIFAMWVPVVIMMILLMGVCLKICCMISSEKSRNGIAIKNDQLAQNLVESFMDEQNEDRKDRRHHHYPHHPHHMSIHGTITY